MKDKLYEEPVRFCIEWLEFRDKRTQEALQKLSDELNNKNKKKNGR